MIKKIKNYFFKAWKICTTVDFKLFLHLSYNRLRYPSLSARSKHNQLARISYIKRRFSHLLDECKKNPVTTEKNTGPIWVCWLQGEKAMPHIIQLCYKRLLEAAPHDREVILITMDNYSKYVEIPDFIIQKVDNKIISYTHFSDILRVSLLAKHGGLWIDSSVYVHGPLPDYVFKHSYFSIKAPFDKQYVSQCKFACFLIGASPNAPWMTITRDILFAYLEKTNIFIDYFLLDHILITAYTNISSLRENIIPGVVYMPYVHTLEKLRNDPCDIDFFKKMITECPFYKLSYRLDFEKITNNGQITYFGQLIKQN